MSLQSPGVNFPISFFGSTIIETSFFQVLRKFNEIQLFQYGLHHAYFEKILVFYLFIEI